MLIGTFRLTRSSSKVKDTPRAQSLGLMIAKDSQKIEKVYLRIVKRPPKSDGIRNDKKRFEEQKDQGNVFKLYDYE